MDHLAKRIMHEQVKPMLEKMLEDGVAEKELYAAEAMVSIAHDLIECDKMTIKLDRIKYGNEYSEGTDEYAHAWSELTGAEEYVKMYSETGDKDYLTMAHDETTHANKFIQAMPDGVNKRECMAKHDAIVERIRAYGMAT